MKEEKYHAAAVYFNSSGLCRPSLMLLLEKSNPSVTFDRTAQHHTDGGGVALTCLASTFTFALALRL